MENYLFNDRTFLWKINSDDITANEVFLKSAVLELVLPSTVILQIYLPESKSLIELPDDSLLEVLYVEDGRPDYYEHGDPIFRFSNCHVDIVRIPEPVSINKEIRPIFVEIEISCVIEVDWENIRNLSTHYDAT